MTDRSPLDRRARRRLAVVALVAVLVAACSSGRDEIEAVTEVEANAAMEAMADIAAARTPAAMERLCALSADDCTGISGSILNATEAPDTAPGPESPPRVLCGRPVGDGAWMLVVEGDDGWGRPYVSQVVLDRRDRDVVPVREPAFWLGIAYTGTKVTGSTAWSTAYGPSRDTAPEHTQRMLERARRACDPA